MSISQPDRTCPLCGGDNGCQHNESCWCYSVKMPKHIFELIPEEKRGKACVCTSCVEKHQRETQELGE